MHLLSIICSTDLQRYRKLERVLLESTAKQIMRFLTVRSGTRKDCQFKLEAWSRKFVWDFYLSCQWWAVMNVVTPVNDPGSRVLYQLVNAA